ncbi:M28 family metallopeptidase [Porphyrobacter sp. CACIAM 03H1]|jgi:Zn-dependent M28 family amino/carboxypeptidase|uniref:M28 family metallopeptidase n=1 Tax=Porphyrobacter sp. CACIAM 03H1 TaxID=2003315 RepID=UPI000B5A633E|nr:M28 family metallopeptidase [Porphyrobacter sp. CACIAM 03H1]ASJ92423.1 peptidase M28 [Porphyrobacter sp. CACIAM 03H1]
MTIRQFAIGTLLAGALALGACEGLPVPGGAGAALDIPEVEPGQLSEATMKDVTRILSSDAFEGRAPGTPGEEKTIALMIERFKAAGLQPGNGESWVQEVPLVEITGKDYAPLTITGKGAPLSFDFRKDWVGVTYREEAATSLSDSELVFVGYGINAPEKGWNDYAGLDVKGKTVVILVNDPDWQTQNLEGPFNGKAMTYYGRWTYKYEEAARQGAAGALIVHQTAPAAYGWNVVESSWTGPQAYAQRGENAPPLTQMNGWLTEDAARKLLKSAGQDLDALTKAAQAKGFKAVPLGMKLSTRFASDVRSFTSHNIIGILPGSEKPDEYVLHTAHWDHLGRCSPAPDGDDICNGAVDNATGTAALVALAEAHAKAGPARRSLVFLAVTAEESGLLGATYYAQNPVYPLAQTVGGVNMDAFQVAGPARDVTAVGLGKSQLDIFLETALKADGRTVTPDPKPENGYYYRSDHFAFAKLGVPMLYIDGGEDLIEGGREAGARVAADYTENRYHGPKDEFDEAWDWSGVMADLQLYYRLGRMMAMSTSWPTWNEGDEFRAIREESCKASDKGC